jgi:hypothetical protein
METKVYCKIGGNLTGVMAVGEICIGAMLVGSNLKIPPLIL